MCAEAARARPRAAARFRTPGQACGAADALTYRGCTDVRIFAVAEDGTETPLPSYEEALARVDVLQKRERRMFDGFRAEIDRIQREINALGADYIDALYEAAITTERNDGAAELGALRADAKNATGKRVDADDLEEQARLVDTVEPHDAR